MRTLSGARLVQAGVAAVMGCPSESVSVPVSTSRPRTVRRVSCAGEIAMLSATCWTTTFTLSRVVSDCARTNVVPLPIAVMTPVPLTAATAGLGLVHVTVGDAMALLRRSNAAAASWRCAVRLVNRTLSGVTSRRAATGRMVTVVLARTVSSQARTATPPVARSAAKQRVAPVPPADANAESGRSESAAMDSVSPRAFTGIGRKHTVSPTLVTIVSTGASVTRGTTTRTVPVPRTAPAVNGVRPSSAVIVALPRVSPRTKPWASTVATAGSLELHVRRSPGFATPPTTTFATSFPESAMPTVSPATVTVTVGLEEENSRSRWQVQTARLHTRSKQPVTKRGAAGMRLLAKGRKRDAGAITGFANLFGSYNLCRSTSYRCASGHQGTLQACGNLAFLPTGWPWSPVALALTGRKNRRFVVICGYCSHVKQVAKTPDSPSVLATGVFF